MRLAERLRTAWRDSHDTIGRYSAATAGLRRATGPPPGEAELAQYRWWVHPEGSSIVALEELIPPPASATVLVVTASSVRFRHVVTRGGLNPASAVHVQYPWQVEGRVGLRVIVLPDAYQLRQWANVQGALEAMPGGLFLLLPA